MSRKKEKKPKGSRPGAEQARLKKGTLEITRSGMGYVVVDDGSGDVMVRPSEFNNALNGDVVRVKIIKENVATNKKEGKIAEVITRKQTEFIGVLQISDRFAFFVPDSDKP